MACRGWLLAGPTDRPTSQPTSNSADHPAATSNRHLQPQVWQRVPAFIRNSYVTFCFSDFNLEEKLQTKEGGEDEDDGCAGWSSPPARRRSLPPTPLTAALHLQLTTCPPPLPRSLSFTAPQGQHRPRGGRAGGAGSRRVGRR